MGDLRSCFLGNDRRLKRVYNLMRIKKTTKQEEIDQKQENEHKKSTEKVDQNSKNRITRNLFTMRDRQRALSASATNQVSPSDDQLQQRNGETSPANEQSPRQQQDAVSKSYKQRNSLTYRRQEVHNIQEKFPGKVAVIVERFKKEKQLPLLDKTKFLVPRDITMSQFVTVIRNRMCIRGQQAIYFLINQKAIASMTITMAELYDLYKDKDDGFLYMTYASQEMFG